MGCNVISYSNETEWLARLSQPDLNDNYEAQKYWADHIYVDDGKLKEILDGGDMVNHSEDPVSAINL